MPPALVLLAVAIAMWWAPPLHPPLLFPWRVVAAAVLALAAPLLVIAGGFRFRSAGTTVSPVRPDRASKLVTGGIYRHTRNPMYLGMALMLCAWAVYLGAALAWLGPPVFVIYITRFQIVPEERALTRLFGDSYVEYRRRVRRWL